MSQSSHSFLGGVLYMILSSASLSVAYLFVKLSSPTIPFFLLIFLRFLIPFLFIALIFAIKRQSIKTKNLRVHFIRALFVLIAQYSIFYYVSKDNLLNATVLLNISPVLIPFIEWLFLEYRIPKSTWISLFISGIGVLLILQPGTNLFTFLSVIGLFAGFFQACSQMIFGLNVKKESAEINIFYLFGFGTLLSLIPIIGIGPTLSIEWTQPLLIYVLLISVMSLLNQYFRAKAYMHRKPSTLSTFLYLTIVISGFFDWIVFDHPPNTLSIIGALLVIIGGLSKIGLRYLTLRRKV